MVVVSVVVVVVVVVVEVCAGAAAGVKLRSSEFKRDLDVRVLVEDILKLIVKL